MLHVLYLAHDLADPAVRRRVLTLQAGGARITLAGFRRDENRLAAVHGINPIELGRTRDAKFAQRMAAVAKASFALSSHLRHVEKPDVIIARNLEMLAVANRAARLFGGDIPVVYECLDIHRLLLRGDAAGKTIRGAEYYLGRNAKLLITSSPAFVENYFRPLSGLDLPVLLLENKVLALDDDDEKVSLRPRAPQAGEPWKIGWFGALRCRKSLELLAAFSRRMEGKFEIVLRGRPAYSEFDDFDAFVQREPFLSFHGPYKNPEDLSAIYNEVQFSWAIDFFEEGQNSGWLLPNRLYEGCLHGAVPIAFEGTETARFLAGKKIGLAVQKADAEHLAAVLGSLDENRYLDAFAAVAAHDREHWITDRADCRTLVQRLAAIARQGPKTAPSHALSQPHRNEGELL
ncbi:MULTISPECIES: glycosyltransferase [unclassified Sinorhizobium]|uniref:glycosyltransferase n=1 Tax=unclassified Sinorhizobium TaxID=2613772 RepID=UPI003526B924